MVTAGIVTGSSPGQENVHTSPLTWLVRLSLNNRRLVALLTVVVAGIGRHVTLTRQPQILPDLTFPVVTVISTSRQGVSIVAPLLRFGVSSDQRARDIRLAVDKADPVKPARHDVGLTARATALSTAGMTSAAGTLTTAMPGDATSPGSNPAPACV